MEPTQDASGAQSPPDEPSAPSASDPKRTWLIVGAIAAALLLVFVVWWLGGDVEVPSVVGLDTATAEATLTASGLALGSVSDVATLAVAPGTVVSQTPAPGESAPEGSRVDVAVAAIPMLKVPDVVGMGGSEAEAALAEAGLRVGTVDAIYTEAAPAGEVTAQEPVAGSEVPVAAAVALEVSAGPKKGAVPDVVGLTSVDAVNTLEAAGFKTTETKKSSEDVAAGVVADQSPEPGFLAEAGTTITLVVSSGAPTPAPAPPAQEQPAPPASPDATPDEQPPASKPEPPAQEAPQPSTVDVPDLLGMGPIEAIRALKKVSLQFIIEWGPSEEAFLKVIAQDPAAGAEVEKGTPVTMTLGLPAFLFGDASPAPLPSEPDAGEQPGAGEAAPLPATPDDGGNQGTPTEEPANPPTKPETSQEATDASAP